MFSGLYLGLANSHFANDAMGDQNGREKRHFFFKSQAKTALVEIWVLRFQ